MSVGAWALAVQFREEETIKLCKAVSAATTISSYSDFSFRGRQTVTDARYM